MYIIHSSLCFNGGHLDIHNIKHLSARISQPLEGSGRRSLSSGQCGQSYKTLSQNNDKDKAKTALVLVFNLITNDRSPFEHQLLPGIVSSVTTSFQQLIEILATTQGKEVKVIWSGRKITKLSLFTHQNYVEKSQFAKNLLYLMGATVNILKLVDFLFTNKL